MRYALCVVIIAWPLESLITWILFLKRRMDEDFPNQQHMEDWIFGSRSYFGLRLGRMQPRIQKGTPLEQGRKIFRRE
jgi:hypothetical protein